MTYQEQLLDPRWLKKRQEVFDYYSFGRPICIVCLSINRIEVHHKRYIYGRMAWEYSKFELVPLCHDCHSIEHDKVDFIRETRHIGEVIFESLSKAIHA
jgi:hypothetical protein